MFNYAKRFALRLRRARRREGRLDQIAELRDDTGHGALGSNATPAQTEDPLIAPAAIDHHHFRDGDSIQFGYDLGAPTGVVTRAEPDDEDLIGVRLFGSDTRARGSDLVHLHDCQPCQTFLTASLADQDRRFALFRDEFTPEALRLADHLYDEGLITTYCGGRECGHGDRYALSPAANLPSWLHAALRDAVLTGPEGPWPNWARTSHPVDWPTLVDRHPDTLVPDHDMLEHNQGATWSAIVEAFTLLRSVDPNAAVDVFLWVSTDGRILVEPMWIGTTFDVPATLATAVDRILTASGRPGEYIHDRGREPDTTSGWMVSC